MGRFGPHGSGMAALGLLLVLVSAVPAAAEGERIDLHVDIVGEWEEPRPLKGGVPFPEGAVRDPDHVVLVDQDGEHVPAQVDVTATYRDGSIRWALLSFVGRRDASYAVKFGSDVRRSSKPRLSVERTDHGGYEIDTGKARFGLVDDALMIERAHVATDEGTRVLFEDGGAGAYVVDQNGREARVTGAAAEIETRVLKEGPQRLTLRRAGWYVTEDGERLARAIVRMSFYGGSAAVKLSHTLVFTEDTNEVWFRDYGIDVPFSTDEAATARFDVSRAFADEPVHEHALAPTESLAMLQETFPHFLSEASRFTLTAEQGGEEGERDEVRAGEVAGDWSDVSADERGMTVVVPKLAEQFPKALEVSADNVRVRLWAGTAGRELDFRSETLVDEYWGEWADEPRGRGVSSREELAEMPSNAQASARTHTLWLLARGRAEDGDVTRRRASAFQGPALVHADPAWIAQSQAMGWPLHPVDRQRFPEAEAMILDFWERTFLTQDEVFPMTGFIAWGVQPYLQWHEIDDAWRPGFYRLSHMIEYGLRERAWNLLARSGDRRYFEFGRRFNRFIFDWGMHHWDADGKRRGGFSMGRTHTPHYWGTGSTTLQTSNSGHTIQNFLFEYFMTGNEVAREAIESFGKAVREDWDASRDLPHPAMAVRVLVSLYTFDWDEAFHLMARELAREQLIDLESPNAINESLDRGRPLRKVHRNAFAFYEYYQATGDPVGREAFIKAVDYEHRFDRLRTPVEYQNAGAFLLSLAYLMTGDDAYRRAAAGMVEAGLAMEHRTLAEDLEDYGLNLARRPRITRGPHLNMHPMLGVPTALALMAVDRSDAGPHAWARRTGPASAELVFTQPDDESPAWFDLFVHTPHSAEPTPIVRSLEGQRIEGVEIEREEQLLEPRPDDERHFHYRMRMPSGLSAGTYRVEFADEVAFGVLDTNVEKLGLYTPRGHWSGFRRRSVDLSPTFFYVPTGTEELRLFANNPGFWLRRPDGEIVLDIADEESGEIVVPVEEHDGFWSIQSPWPVFWELRNITPLLTKTPQHAVPEADRAWFEHDAEEAAQRRSAADPARRFVEGPQEGDALHLSAGTTFRFPRGDARRDGGYAHFPGKEGTIEFWFRPNWASDMLEHGGLGTDVHDWIVTDAVDFSFRKGVGTSSQQPYSHLYLNTTGSPGPAIGTPIHRGNRPHWFERGEWVHLAATWRIESDDQQTDATITLFVDGRRVAAPHRIERDEPYELTDVAEWVRIGGDLDGGVSDLRISDVVRYESEFDPTTSPESDESTRALFRFNGTLEGVSGEDEKPISGEFVE